MKLTTSTSAMLRSTRSVAAVVAPNQMRCVARQRRSHATHSNPATGKTLSAARRSVTPFNDDGHVPWKQLSGKEKTARATQQTFNFFFVIAGVVLTGAVAYFMWTDVFDPDSKTAQFNRAFDRIKKDARCIEVLGDSKKMVAYGSNTNNHWRRARHIATTTERTDEHGNQHLVMSFHVDGPLRDGVAQFWAVKQVGHSDYEYRHLMVDVEGHERIYLEKTSSPKTSAKRQLSLFGVKW
ncbi:hypothetical protein E4U59_001300 [Claviceps monticola]|nr:hypothetical protein E4U59_001300 [Claviceps monticola]